MTYDHSKIEKKWQKIWQKNKFKSWQARNLSKKKKFYILDMFPYPSGDGLHVGHIEGYTATDIYSRYLRMNNYNVLHPMGFDAFGHFADSGHRGKAFLNFRRRSYVALLFSDFRFSISESAFLFGG